MLNSSHQSTIEQLATWQVNWHEILRLSYILSNICISACPWPNHSKNLTLIAVSSRSLSEATSYVVLVSNIPEFYAPAFSLCILIYIFKQTGLTAACCQQQSYLCSYPQKYVCKTISTRYQPCIHHTLFMMYVALLSLSMRFCIRGTINDVPDSHCRPMVSEYRGIQ